MASKAEKMKAALEKMQKVREGVETRTGQYEVKEEAPIMKTISEEEYAKLKDSRRESFVVGKDLGYDDSGKELWEDPESKKEALRGRAEDEKEIAAARAEKAAAKGGTTSSAAAPEPPTNSDGLMKALSAGGRGVGITASSAPQPQDLQNMLSGLCGVMADEPMGEALDAAAAKRKLDDATGQSGQAKAAKKSHFGGPSLQDELTDFAAELTKPQAVPVAAAPFKAEPSPQATPATAAIRTAQPAAFSPAPSMPAPVPMSVDGAPPGVNFANATGQKFEPVKEEDGSMWFFLVDAVEDDRAGKVFLFGKVRAKAPGAKHWVYQNCCFIVESIEKCVHLLLDVEDTENIQAMNEAAACANIEFDQICQQQCPGLRKLRSKLKLRNYAFEKPLPNGEGQLPFLKIVYDSAGMAPPQQLTGSTFCLAFGTQTSLIERLYTTRRVMGPSWLRLEPGSWTENPHKMSFCPLEFRGTPKSIFAAKKEQDRRWLSDMGMPATSPPLRVLSLSMQTWQPSAQQGHEPVVLACTLHPNVGVDTADKEAELHMGMQNWIGVRRMDSRPLPRDAETMLPSKQIQHFSSETALYHKFLEKIQEYDPDVIACHNAFNFDLDVLATRLSALRVNFWQKLGRLRRPKERMPNMAGRSGGGGFWIGSMITSGRLVCDVLMQAKDMLPKLGAYDLPNLARHQIQCPNLKEVEPENMSSFYDTALSLSQLAELTRYNAYCIARLMYSLQILPLTKQLTNLAGNTWNASLQNKRADRNEFLLCHEFHKNKFVVPDKESALMKKRRAQIESGAGGGGFDDGEDNEPTAVAGGAPRRGKAQYSGGLVLEPKAGLYDDFVLMLDFNSLYPSIIQEHNICFTTVERPNEKQVAQCQSESELLSKTRLPDGMEDEGILPQILRKLVDTRKSVKAAIKGEKDPKRLQALDIRQKAIKLTANSIYGTLGFQNSRFYAKPLAAIITAKGREALQTTIDVVNNELSLEVIYGDTDSVFVHSKTNDYNQAMRAAQQIKSSVNKRYKKLEIEVDGLFCRLLLLKKKKYAAVKVVDWKEQTFEQETKGLDIVRRDWCPLARELGELVLKEILQCREGKEAAVDAIHEILRKKGAEIANDEVTVEKYSINRGLTKAPKDYPDAKHQPHVQVALRMIARGKNVLGGQEVPFVICEDGTGSGATAVSLPDGGKASFAERARHPLELAMDHSLKIDKAWYLTQQVHPVIARMLTCVEGTDAGRVAECLGMDPSRFNRQNIIVEAGSSGATYGGASNVDLEALLDRKLRWKDRSSQLAGVKCPKCAKPVAWERLLRPEVSSESKEHPSAASLFKCGDCEAEMNPRVAQNQLVMQLRKLLREHCEGWVVTMGDDIEGGVGARSRRLKQGKNEVSERQVLQELEYMEHLCETANSYGAGDDDRHCREAAKDMRKASQRLLECNGYNWVDCGQLFGSIFSFGQE